MKVYVAGRTKNKDRVSRLMRLLETHGHTITFDWTGSEGTIAPSGTGFREMPERGRELAEREMQAVFDADVTVLCHGPDLLGAAVEIGLSLGEYKRVIILEDEHDRDCVFWYLPGVYRAADEDELIQLIEKHERELIEADEQLADIEQQRYQDEDEVAAEVRKHVG